MGEYQLIYTSIAAIVFVAAIVGGRFFIVSNFLQADIESQTTTRELNAMSLSYTLLDCFKQGGDAVNTEYLEQNKGKNICELCGICSIIGEARVTDLESEPEKVWEFEYSALTGLPQALGDKLSVWRDDRNKKSYSIYLDIDYGEESHIGRLDVNV
jgi:hypothetical protein